MDDEDIEALWTASEALYVMTRHLQRQSKAAAAEGRSRAWVDDDIARYLRATARIGDIIRRTADKQETPDAR